MKVGEKVFYSLDDSKPVFQQIKEMIENDIVTGVLKEEEQIPSTNQLVAYYKINPATILKGFNLLVDEGIIYKKRGLGMFVCTGSVSILREKRLKSFQEQYIQSMLREASQLEIGTEDIIRMIRGGKV